MRGYTVFEGNQTFDHLLKRGYQYSVVVRRILPYFECKIRLLQENQCGIRFLYCYVVNTVAENWDLNEQLTDI